MSTEQARLLRRNQTKAEKTLWEMIRNRKIGLKFYRQKPILFQYSGTSHAFYVDFFCPEKKLVIEIDGKIHENKNEYDKFRENILIDLGYNIIRFKMMIFYIIVKMSLIK